MKEAVLSIEGVGIYQCYCPTTMEEGEYCIEYGTSLEISQVNREPYGWFVGGVPVLKKETDHGVYIKAYNELSEILETSSFWTGEINEMAQVEV